MFGRDNKADQDKRGATRKQISSSRKKKRNEGLIWSRGNLFSGVVTVLKPNVECMTFSQSLPFANYKELVCPSPGSTQQWCCEENRSHDDLFFNSEEEKKKKKRVSNSCTLLQPTGGAPEDA